VLWQSGKSLVGAATAMRSWSSWSGWSDCASEMQQIGGERPVPVVVGQVGIEVSAKV